MVESITEKPDKAYDLRVAVHEILSLALNEGIEGRNRLREPFLASVFIQPEGDAGPSLTGFSRDVSAEGVGLLHSFPLDLTDTVVEFPRPNRKSLRLQVKITWCKPFGEGWYVSGGQFITRLDP
jgi:hypothetical protein